MINDLIKIIKKNYILNYIVLTIVILLFSFLYVYFTGSSFRYVKKVFFLFSLITLMVLSGYLVVDYFILKLLHINISFKEIHKDLAWINILRLIIGFTLYFGLFCNRMIVENLNNIFKTLLLICKIWVIKKNYDIQWKKVVCFVGVLFILQVGLHLLLALTK